MSDEEFKGLYALPPTFESCLSCDRVAVRVDAPTYSSAYRLALAWNVDREFGLVAVRIDPSGEEQCLNPWRPIEERDLRFLLESDDRTIRLGDLTLQNEGASCHVFYDRRHLTWAYRDVLCREIRVFLAAVERAIRTGQRLALAQRAPRRRNVDVADHVRLALLACPGDTLAIQLQIHNEGGWTPASKATSLHREALVFALTPFGDRTIAAGDLQIHFRGDRASIVWRYHELAQCLRGTIVDALWSFLATLDGEPDRPRPRSIDDVWRSVGRRRPTATRVEDAHGNRLGR